MKTIDQAILSVIENNFILEQEEILDFLKKNNFEITQSSLSRRLKKLNIIKQNGIYKPIQSKNNEQLLHIDIAEPNMLIIHTLPGNASSLAYKIDQMLDYKKPSKKSGILGTIAGDDTILVIIDIKYSLENIKLKIKDAL